MHTCDSNAFLTTLFDYPTSHLRADASEVLSDKIDLVTSTPPPGCQCHTSLENIAGKLQFKYKNKTYAIMSACMGRAWIGVEDRAMGTEKSRRERIRRCFKACFWKRWLIEVPEFILVSDFFPSTFHFRFLDALARFITLKICKYDNMKIIAIYEISHVTIPPYLDSRSMDIVAPSCSQTPIGAIFFYRAICTDE